MHILEISKSSSAKTEFSFFSVFFSSVFGFFQYRRRCRYLKYRDIGFQLCSNSGVLVVVTGHWSTLIWSGTTMSPQLSQKLERDCGSWNSWEEQAFARMTFCTIIRQLCDLFSNMRAHIGRQVLRKNRRNNLMFSFMLFRSFFGNIPYDEARRTYNILSLDERRHELGKRFFQIIIKDNSNSNVLFFLLPAKRHVQLTTRLRCARQYPIIYARTNRYKNSFVLFGLNHFLWCDFVYAWFSCMFV